MLVKLSVLVEQWIVQASKGGSSEENPLLDVGLQAVNGGSGDAQLIRLGSSSFSANAFLRKNLRVASSATISLTYIRPYCQGRVFGKSVWNSSCMITVKSDTSDERIPRLHRSTALRRGLRAQVISSTASRSSAYEPGA